jgi:hypothetical protein
MLPACLTDCLPLPAGGVATDGVGVVADPGSGVVLSLVGGDVGVSLTGGELTGGELTGGELTGGELTGGEELVAGGELDEVPLPPDGLHEVFAIGTPAIGPTAPGALGPVISWEPLAFSPEVPDGAELPSWVFHGRALELSPVACGRVMTAKAPAATTKMAVPIAATGRSQPYRPRPCSESPPGRNRSAAVQKNSSAAETAGSAQEASRTAAPEHHAAAVASENTGDGRMRARMRSSPSAPGSIFSAAACSAWRSTSS